jgi:hypothetical protein
VHQPICYKLKNKPARKKWDERKKRLQGTVFEGYKPKYKNEFHDIFELCLSRRDQANMQRIIESLKISREEYVARARELKLDNDLYFRCKCCREIMHQSIAKSHECSE